MGELKALASYSKGGDNMTYSIQEKLIHVNPKTRPGTKIKVAGVVIHWTANEGKGAGNENHYNYFNKGTVYASAHYFVDSKGILRIIPENEMAYHVGAKTYKTKQFGAYPNDKLIGVEMCVNSDGNFSETYKRSVWLVADILRRHKLGIDVLVRHFDVTGKACPLMFTSDTAAKKYMGLTAAQAHAKFRKDVADALNPPVVKPPVVPAPKSPTPSTVDGSIGTIEVLVDKLNVRKSDSFTAPTERTLKKGGVFKVYGLSNGLYNVGGGDWVSAGAAYVKFTPKPVTTYTVAKGDTLWGVATKHKLTVDKLKELNKLKSDVLSIGQKLIVT